MHARHLLALAVSALLLSACQGAQSQPEKAQDSKPHTDRKATQQDQVDAGTKVDMGDNIKVYISRGARQCESPGEGPEQTARRLNEHNIPVIASECGTLTGMMVIAMCGAQTLDINIHTIANKHLPAAKALNFLPLKSLVDHDQGRGFQIGPCPDFSHVDKGDTTM